MNNEPHFFEFTIYLLFAMFFSIGAIRASHFFYSKIVTCHPAKYHLDTSQDQLEPGEDYEKLSRKISWLYVYNIGIAATTLLVLLVYQRGPFGGQLAVNTKNSMIIITVVLVLNFGLRITALVDLQNSTDYFDQIKERLLSFGNSFLLTLYYLGLIGLGKFVLNTGFGFSVTLGLQPSDDLGLYFTLVVLLGPLVSAALSVIVLHPMVFGVKEDGFDDI